MGYRRASGVYRGRGPREHRFEDAEGSIREGRLPWLRQPGMCMAIILSRAVVIISVRASIPTWPKPSEGRFFGQVKPF